MKTFKEYINESKKPKEIDDIFKRIKKDDAGVRLSDNPKGFSLINFDDAKDGSMDKWWKILKKEINVVWGVGALEIDWKQKFVN